MGRRIGDRIPGRLARVERIRIENRDGREFVVYELTDSLSGPQGRNLYSPRPVR